MIFTHPCKILIVRHGQSQANADEVFAGGTVDSPLTVKGEEDAARCAQSVAMLDEKPELIISGGLLRTDKTARTIIEKAYGEKKPELVTDPQLNERNWGDLSGQKKELYPKFCKERQNPPRGESLPVFEARSNQALCARLDKYNGTAPPLVTGHKGTIEAIVHAFGLDFPGEPENGVLYEIDIVPNKQKKSELYCRVFRYSLNNGVLEKLPVTLVPHRTTEIA